MFAEYFPIIKKFKKIALHLKSLLYCTHTHTYTHTNADGETWEKQQGKAIKAKRQHKTLAAKIDSYTFVFAASL